MPDGYKGAKPFSNGSEAEYFDETFCQRCAKRRHTPDGLPAHRNCKTESAIGEAYIDTERWPKDGNLVEDQFHRVVCLNFFSDDPEVMEAYERAVPQTFLGCVLHNLSDGYLANNQDGSPVLRCGTRENLEKMLLVIFSHRAQSILVSSTPKDANTEGEHGERESVPG